MGSKAGSSKKEEMGASREMRARERSMKKPMKISKGSRGSVMTLVLAVVLAASATTAVYLYVLGVQDEGSSTAGPGVSVIVAKEDIPVGTRLDELVSQGAFEEIEVPEEALVPEAVIDLSQLSGQETRQAIIAGEQIPMARITGTVTGGQLGIPQGHTAVTLPMDQAPMVGGAVRSGDHVTVYGTFTKGVAGDTTFVLVPDAQVLDVNGGITGSQLTGGMSEATITFALKPADAQTVVLAQEQGSVWLALLPPGAKAEQRGPVTIGSVQP